MADFCWQCSQDMFGSPDAPVKSDFHGLLSKEDFYKGYLLPVLCEGCGYIHVDPLGRRSEFKEDAKDAHAEEKDGKSIRPDS